MNDNYDLHCSLQMLIVIKKNLTPSLPQENLRYLHKGIQLLPFAFYPFRNFYNL